MHDDGAILEFRLPDLGEGLAEAELVSWSVDVGDHVDLNQIIAEVETAKAVVALPCPYVGTVAELLAEPGQTVPVGAGLIRVRDEGANEQAPAPTGAAREGRSVAGEQAATTTTAGAPPGNTGVAPEARDTAATGAERGGDARSRGVARSRGGTDRAGADAEGSAPANGDVPVNGDVPANGRRSVLVGYGPQGEFHSRRHGPVTQAGAAQADDQQADDQQADDERAAAGIAVPAVPAARRLAKDLGLDLARITGSGPGGAVTVADVQAASDIAKSAAERAPRPDLDGREIRTPVAGVRKRTAAAMVTSATTVPQAATFRTLDCTASMELIEHLRATPSFAGLPLTPLTVVAKAVLAALAEYPAVNAHWDEAAQQIVTKKYVNLGIAAATERGLLVPNVKEAQAMSLRELCAAVGSCVETARSGAATPTDLTGGTFTVTNVGVFGVDAGIPLVNPGEAAILCLGTVDRRPWVVDDELAVRWVTTLVLSFDHRLIDGELAARFLATVAALLTDPLTLLSR